MRFYHIEPILNFTHVLKAYTNLPTTVAVRLLCDNKPMDCSEATGVSIAADKYAIDEDAIDARELANGILRFHCMGLPVGGYRMPITLTFEDETIVFGPVVVFVSDTTRSDDIAVFNQYPDTDDELEAWESGEVGLSVNDTEDEEDEAEDEEDVEADEDDESEADEDDEATDDDEDWTDDELWDEDEINNDDAEGNSDSDSDGSEGETGSTEGETAAGGGSSEEAGESGEEVEGE